MSYLSNSVDTTNNNWVPCFICHDSQMAMCIDKSNNIFFCSSAQVKMIPAYSANPNVMYGISGAIVADNSYSIQNSPTGSYQNLLQVIANNGYAMNYTGRGGAAYSAGINNSKGICLDTSGNIYVAERDNNAISIITKASGTYWGQAMTAGYIYSVVGNGTSGDGNGVLANGAVLNGPSDVATDSSNNLYICDTYNTKIKFVPAIGGTYWGQTMTARYIYTIAGGTTNAAGTNNVLATTVYVSPSSVSLDNSGNIYYSEDTHIVRMIPKVTGTYWGQSMTANYVYTVAGIYGSSTSSPGTNFTTDVLATTSMLCYPGKPYISANGNLFICDSGSYTLRMVANRSGYYYGRNRRANYISTVMGKPFVDAGGLLPSTTTIPCTSLSISYVLSIMFDSYSNMYINNMCNGNSYVYVFTAMDNSKPIANYIFPYAFQVQTGTIYNVSIDFRQTMPTNLQSIYIDSSGNIYIGTQNGVAYMVPNVSGTYWNTSMTASTLNVVAGNSNSGSSTPGNNVLAANNTSGIYNYTLSDVTTDNSGNMFICDSLNYVIAMVARTTGTFYGKSMTANYNYTLAGSTNSANTFTAGAVPTSVYIGWTNCVIVDRTANVYISTGSGIYFIPNTTGTFYSTSMTQYRIYRLTTSYAPSQMRFDSSGNILFGNGYNSIGIIPMTTGTYYGTAMTAYTISTITFSPISTTGETSININTSAICPDSSGNIYVGGNINNTLNPIGFIPKVSGTYWGITMTANNLYAITRYMSFTNNIPGNPSIDCNSYAARPFPLAYVSIVGTYSIAVDLSQNMLFVDTRLYYPQSLDMIPSPYGNTSNNYYTTYMNSNRIYTLTGGTTVLDSDKTVLQQFLPGTNFSSTYVNDLSLALLSNIYNPGGIVKDTSGNLYMSITGHNVIRLMPAISGTYYGQSMKANFVYTIAGTGTASYSGDTGAATSATFNKPNDICRDNSGNLYIADLSNNRIRYIPFATGTVRGQSMTANYVYTIAGTGTAGYSGDTGAATSANIQINNICLDNSFNIYISDSSHRIRFIPFATGTVWGQSMTANNIYTIAGTGTAGSTGDSAAATSATINTPRGISVDNSFNVYISDSGNNKIRFISFATGTVRGQSMTANNIYTIAGTGTAGSSGDGGAATSATISTPYGLYVDRLFNVYVADRGNHKVRAISFRSGTNWGQTVTANNIYTVAGNGIAGGSNGYYGVSGDFGLATASSLNNPTSVFVNNTENLYISDSSNNAIRVVCNLQNYNYKKTESATVPYTYFNKVGSGFYNNGVDVYYYYVNNIIPTEWSFFTNMSSKLRG